MSTFLNEAHVRSYYRINNNIIVKQLVPLNILLPKVEKYYSLVHKMILIVRVLIFTSININSNQLSFRVLYSWWV